MNADHDNYAETQLDKSERILPPGKSFQKKLEQVQTSHRLEYIGTKKHKGWPGVSYKSEQLQFIRHLFAEFKSSFSWSLLIFLDQTEILTAKKKIYISMIQISNGITLSSILLYLFVCHK